MRARSVATVLVASALILAGCGYDGDVRDFINDTYVLQSSNGDTAVYASDDPVGPTTSTIVNAVNPAARQSDGGSEYLRYDDDIVIVSAALGGSTVRVEDLDGRYRGGFFAFLARASALVHPAPDSAAARET
jgi:hypothetical protein